jgi:hypothetical protein
MTNYDKHKDIGVEFAAHAEDDYFDCGSHGESKQDMPLKKRAIEKTDRHIEQKFVKRLQ